MSLDGLEDRTHLEIVRHVVILLSGSSENGMRIGTAVSLVGRRRLSVVPFLKRIALRGSLILSVRSHDATCTGFKEAVVPIGWVRK